MISLLRPVASTAARRSGSDQAGLGRAVDRGDLGEDVADLAEDGVGEPAPLGADRGQDGRHAEYRRRLGQPSDVIDQDAAVDGGSTTRAIKG